MLSKNTKRVCLVVTALILVFLLYQFIGMKDYCGLRVGEELVLDDSIPDSVFDSVHSIGHTYFFQNRFGHILVVERDFYFDVVSIQCFNKHLVNKTEFNFRTIQPATPLDEVLRKFGLPDRIDPYSSFHALVYTIGDGTEYHVFVIRDQSLDGQEEMAATREKSVFKDGFGGDYLEPLSNQEYTKVLTLFVVGTIILVITTGIILLYLKKKGILFKKKQVSE